MTKKNNESSEVKRCGWCGVDPMYVKYHDEEWGREVTDDEKMFEFIVLEGAQAGLSWFTILKKREHYRKAFANFDVQKVAKFTQKKVEALMQNANIVRNRNKIESTISNARCFIEIQKEFGSFCNYMKSFLPNKKPIINYWKTLKEIPTTTILSDTISNDMKKRGFKFFGSTICYSHLQAVGYVNDHLIDCHCRSGQ
jgi:DNA-3-methyladenine glycosylase I